MSLINWVLKLFDSLPDALKVVILLVLIVGLIVTTALSIVYRRAERATKKQLREVTENREEYRKRLEGLDQAQGHVWTQPDKLEHNQFQPKKDRSTRFISLFNLKGGSGKTTTTINLGACLAAMGNKVLLVDLDFQGTLSNYFAEPPRLIERCREQQLTIRKLLADDATVDTLNSCLFQLEQVQNCWGIAAWEDLESVEYSLQARYYVNVKDDLEVRFLLQRLLHTDAIFRQFDYVLFDCPPRLTTACINGLTCSDYVLLPAATSDADIESIGRTLSWLEDLSTIVQAQVLGAVISRCSMRADQIVKADEQKIGVLDGKINKHLPGNNHILTAKIPDRAEIRRSKRRGRPIVLDSTDAQGWYNAVGNEVLQRMN